MLYLALYPIRFISVWLYVITGIFIWSFLVIVLLLLRQTWFKTITRNFDQFQTRMQYYCFIVLGWILDINLVISKPHDFDFNSEPSIFLHSHASVLDNAGMTWIVEGVPFSFLAKEELFRWPFVK